jgi:tRNA(Leu) C34 or U34 (ribose-2'-O)-methylase TrmL
MEFIEIIENPGVAVRVCGTYRKMLIVIKFFGNDMADRSMKIYEKLERFAQVKSRWNTTIPVTDARVESFMARSSEFLEDMVRVFAS